MARLKLGSLAVVATLLVSGCSQGEVFTLYRNSRTSGGEAKGPSANNRTTPLPQGA